jgi:RNA polymerase sigma-70 factor, ECF subfamily
MNIGADTPGPRPVREGNDDTEWALIRRVGAGDRRAFETLYQQYYHQLFRFIYRITRRLDPVEEIINDVMFVVWQKAGIVETKSRASTWILGIAYKKSLKSLTFLKRVSSDVSLNEMGQALREHDESMIRQLEMENLAVTALGALAPEQRAIMELAYYQEMHYSEIAAVIGCPENTVKTRMFHARKRLRSLMPVLLEGPAKPQHQ